MKTLERFSHPPDSLPAVTTYYLSDLGEARGKQELLTRQSPQRLRSLREHAIIESAVSSNRIEGVEIESRRIGTVLFGKGILHDRNEEEVRGYRRALRLIHEQAQRLSVSEETVLRLHSLIRGEIWDAGHFKDQDGDILERHPDGRERVRFRTVSAAQTPDFMLRLFELQSRCLRENWVHPLLALGAVNLDFLCVHPFRDGNGRVSRLLLLLQSYHLGYEVGRYISLERLIEQNKERYYETLEQSSHGWHEGKHDPWAYINFLLYILKSAYKEFQDRLERLGTPRGEKTQVVLLAIDQSPEVFSVGDILRQCPGVSIDTIRRVLKIRRASEQLECLGRGQNAQWRKTPKWEMGITHMNGE